MNKLEHNQVSSSITRDSSPDIFERAIIGCLLQCEPLSAVKIAGKSDPELFSMQRNQHAYNVIRNAAFSGNPLGYATAAASIHQSSGSLEHFSSHDAVQSFLDECIEISNPHLSWPEYVKQLHLAHTRRKLMAAFDDGTISALSASSAEDAAADAIAKVIEAAGELRRNSCHESYAIDKVVDRYLERYADPDNHTTTFAQRQLNTGGGFRPGQIIIPCAMSGVGKSWWCLDLMLHAYKEHGRSSRIYSLEMDENDFLDRAISMENGVDLNKVINREYPLADMEDWAADIAEMPISIVDKRISPGRIISDLAALGEDRPDIVVVDHTDLFAFKEGNEVNALKNAMANFKDAAKEYGVVFILVCQFRRPRNDDEAKMPHMAMLKGGAALEQIADMIIFINKELDRTHFGDTEVYKMWTVKQRMGKPAGRFDVKFTRDYKFR